MNVISIDETDSYILVSGIVLKLLKRFGWQCEEVEQRGKEVHLEILQLIRGAEDYITRELAAYTAECGFDEQALHGLARTEYAIRAFDLATNLNKRRVAACN